MAPAEFHEAVLRLERVVEQQVQWRERLGSKRRVGIAAREDVDERKERGKLAAALVLLRVASDQAVRHAAADHGVPLADARMDVLENRVVGVLKVQEVVAERLTAEAERRRTRQVHVRARLQLVVAERHLVLAVDVVIAFDQERLRGRVLRNVLIRASGVVEFRLEERTERVEIRRQHARDVARRRRATWIRDIGRQGPRVLLTLEALEEEQLVLHDRPAQPLAGRRRLERTGIDRLSRRFGSDVRVVAIAVVARSDEVVRSAARDGVHARADEVALANIEWRHAHLHLLDRFERNRRDASAIARLAGKAERVVEVRAVHRDVVHPVVLAREVAASAVLRREPRHVVDASGNRRQRGQFLAKHRGRRAGV